MSHDAQDILVGAYQDLEAAKRDFDAVTALVKAKQIKVEGVILVEHDELAGHRTTVDDRVAARAR